MSNPIVKALENGAQKLGKTLAKDASKVVQALKEPNPDKPAANIPLTRIAFNSAAKAVINPHIFDQSYATLTPAAIRSRRRPAA